MTTITRALVSRNQKSLLLRSESSKSYEKVTRFSLAVTTSIYPSHLLHNSTAPVDRI